MSLKLVTSSDCKVIFSSTPFFSFSARDLQGGYNLTSIKLSMTACASVLLGNPPEDLEDALLNNITRQG